MSVVLAEGGGCHLRDANGKSYVDFSMGWGSVLPGHAHPEIVEAVCRQAERGTNFAFLNEQSVALGHEITLAFPSIEQLRFCGSGTEAILYCVRLARAFTGRTKLLKFEGAYHGAGDVGVVSLFPQRYPDFPGAEATSAGLPSGTEKDVLVAPFNDLETTGQILEQHAPDIAAILVEPLHRCFPPVEGFLQGLRALATKHNCVLIFDEVVTGFRLAYGGAQQRYDVHADLTALGKALGGGLPIGAFGGRKEILAYVREDRMGKMPYVWSASTLGGNPVSCAAALAALKLYRAPGVYEHLYALGAQFRGMLAQSFAHAGITAQILGDGPLAQFALLDTAPNSTRALRHSDKARARDIMLRLLTKGIWLNPMGTKLYLSLAHDDESLQAFTAALGEVLD